jgi:hypothetical protein
VLGIKVSALRDITLIAAGTAGKFLPGMEFMDDLIFAGIDVTQGDRSVGDVAFLLAKEGQRCWLR